jgi:translation initiation factor 3 subunit M
MSQSQMNYMVVDGVLRDYIQEVSAYIDQLDGIEAGSENSLEKYTSSLMEEDGAANEAEEKTFEAIVKKSKVLSNAAEREFEPAYNLILHILTFAPDLKKLLPILVDNLTSEPPKGTNGSVQVLSVLSNLFNILPVESPLRHQVFLAIVEFAKSSGNIHLLVSQLKRLPQWLGEWGLDGAAQRDVYTKISEVLSQSGDSQASYDYLVKAVASVSGTGAAASPLAAKLVKLALVSEHIYEFDELLALDAVQELRKSEASLFKLLEVISVGDYQQYLQISNSGIASDLDKAALDQKIRVLALCVAASKSSSRTIAYADIASAIEVPVDTVELWVIDAIRAGLVEGRLSQIDQVFDIHRVTPIGKFGIEEWKLVEQRLDTWKQSLREVSEVIRNARESAQKEKKGKSLAVN